MEAPIADSFSVWLTDSASGTTVECEIVVGLNPFVSILNSISPPTQGDGSGQPVHELANPRNDLIARLRDHHISVGTWFVLTVDEVVPGTNELYVWHQGPWFGHASVEIVDTLNNEIYIYGFHMNGLGRWLTSGLRGSILDNAHYNYDIGRAWPITYETYTQMKDWFSRQRANPPLYTILGNNCFEWALKAAGRAGIHLQITSTRDEFVMYQNVQGARLWLAQQNLIRLPN